MQNWIYVSEWIDTNISFFPEKKSSTAIKYFNSNIFMTDFEQSRQLNCNVNSGRIRWKAMEKSILECIGIDSTGM